MTFSRPKSQLWRGRADEYRSQAERASSPITRETYLDLASAWERTARQLEQLEALLVERSARDPRRAAG